MLKPSQGEEISQVEPKFKTAGFSISTLLLLADWYPTTTDIQVKNKLGGFIVLPGLSH